MLNKVTLILIVCMFFFSVATVNLYTVEVKTKEEKDFNGFQKGKLHGTTLDSKGRLAIGPKIKKITGPEREYYLSVDIVKNGDIYVGTGHKAGVYKISPDAAENKITSLFDSPDSDVYALLVKENGVVYAGTSPSGKLYKIAKDKSGQIETKKVFFDPEEKFIWDIKEDANGNIIVATGSNGGVYKLNKDGNASNIFTPEDIHIVSLYVTRANSILAGSGDRGVLYKIDNRKVKVLFDSPFEEIRGICEDKDGNIFFSATRGIKKNTGTNNSVVETFLSEKKAKKKTPKEKSILYCCRTNGVVEKIWTSGTEYIYSLCYDPQENNVLVGTGNSGRVYRVDIEGSYSIVYETEAAQVFKIAAMPQNRGFVIIADNTAEIAGIENVLNSKGVYFSEVYDLGIQSKLGKIYWDAKIGTGTGVSLAVRTGNSNVPDSTWSKWSAPFSNSEDSSIAISGVRYFQVKAVLNSNNPATTPTLNNYRVFYVQSNLKPRLKKIDIRKPGEKIGKKSPVIITAGAKPRLRKQNRLKLSWEASDPNHDKLKYNLYIKKNGDKNWIRVKEDIQKNRAELDPRLFEDGKYRLRVVADDALSNPPSNAKTVTLISSPFLIDSTAPVITRFTVQAGKISFTVDDKTSNVSKVLYSYEGKKWYPLFPIDIIADSRSEKFNFSLKDLAGKKD